MTYKETYLITSAQANARPHKQFFDSLMNYKRLHNIPDKNVLILPMSGIDAREQQLKDIFHNFTIVDNVYHINDSLQVKRARIRPQMIDPITGQSDMVRKGKSTIMESPQIRFKTYATNPNRQAKFIATPGAITIPRYASTDEFPQERQRLGLKALSNHEQAAIVVNIVNRNKYHWRHLEANYKGEFVDFNTVYTPNGIRDAVCLALDYGDHHWGAGDPKAYTASNEQAKLLKPKAGVYHDFFDMRSVNHHMRKQLIFGLIRQGIDTDSLNLEKELREGGQELNRQAKLHDKIYLVRSNHHEFLEKWLDEGQFVKDPRNARFGFQLAMAYSHGKDPVEEGVKLAGVTLDDRINFLGMGEELRVKGFTLENHGHLGPNGGPASVRNREESYGKSKTGHKHSPEIYHRNETLGVHLPRNTPYCRGGPTAWMHRNSAIFDTGTSQSYNTIDGKFR